MNEIRRLKHDLQLSGYPQGFIDSVINSEGSSLSNKDKKPLGSVHIPYVKGFSEKFRRIANKYNIRTIFKTEQTLRSVLMKTRRKENDRKNNTAECVCANVADVTL
jgi:hypothetical protein